MELCITFQAFCHFLRSHKPYQFLHDSNECICSIPGNDNLFQQDFLCIVLEKVKQEPRFFIRLLKKWPNTLVTTIELGISFLNRRDIPYYFLISLNKSAKNEK